MKWLIVSDSNEKNLKMGVKDFSIYSYMDE